MKAALLILLFSLSNAFSSEGGMRNCVEVHKAELIKELEDDSQIFNEAHLQIIERECRVKICIDNRLGDKNLFEAEHIDTSELEAIESHCRR